MARSPILPLQRYKDWSQLLVGEENTAADAGVVDTLRRALRELCEDQVIAQAIFIASRALSSDVQELGDGDHKADLKPDLALARYFTRMCWRSTPFGLFAGVSFGRIAQETRLELGSFAEYRPVTRIDFGYLSDLVHEALSDTRDASQQVFVVNGSLWKRGRRYCFIERRGSDRNTTYELVAINATPPLDALIGAAFAPIKYRDLLEVLISCDVGRSEAHELIQAAIASQVLVSEHEVAITVPDEIDTASANLLAAGRDGSIRQHLQWLRQVFKDVTQGKRPLDEDLSSAVLAQAPSHEPASSRWFAVDLVKPAPQLTLNERLAGDILDGITLLHSISPSAPDRELQAFAQRFASRFGSREVLLLEALDEEHGVGFGSLGDDVADPSPLVENIKVAAAMPRQQWTPRDEVLRDIVLEAFGRGLRDYVLESKHLTALQGTSRREPLPDVFVATMALSATSGPVDATSKIRVDGCTGPGVGLLGRFCSADKDLRAAVAEVTRGEDARSTGGLVAEVAFTPSGSAANVARRPPFRRYEIPCLSPSSVPFEDRIPLGDLTVSVVGGAIRLRSRSRGCFILPRLSCAHAFSSPTQPGPYRFLGALQRQGVAFSVGWSWGAMSGCAFLPRISYERFVFTRARWMLGVREFTRLALLKNDRARVPSGLPETLHLPDQVVVQEGDNELLVDFRNPLLVEAALQVVNRRSAVICSELFPAYDDAALHGPEGLYAAQYMIPYVRQDRKWHKSRSAGTAGGSTLDAKAYFPGSEWLYGKIYCSPSIADQLLAEELNYVTNTLSEQGIIDRWFFVRYADPEYHLRLRLHGNIEGLRTYARPVIEELINAHGRAGTVWKIAYDTYEPEYIRYGGVDGVAASERIFHCDSEAVLASLIALDGQTSQHFRWLVGLRSVSDLLETLLDSQEERRELVVRQARLLANGLGLSREELRHQVSVKYRTLRRLVEPTVSGAEDVFPQSQVVWEAFSRRSHRVVDALRVLRNVSGGSTVDTGIVASHMHMALNRVLRRPSGLQEMLIYAFIGRAYESSLARERRSRLQKE